MKRALKKSSGALDRLFNNFGVDKKKGIMAVCLVAVMVFMWVRMLTKKAPASAQGGVTIEGENQDLAENDAEPKIFFVELPYARGRNDVLTRDFFTVEQAGLNDVEETTITTENDKQNYVRKVAASLKLEAIGLGDNPQAFINDKLLSVGDKLYVRDGTETYECEVAIIRENMVMIRYGEAQIELKLMRASETGD